MPETQSFHLLDQQVQRWIWKQGWTSLLEIQENTIPCILEGLCDVIVSAPTGGGKTEAVFLPIISKMLHGSESPGYYVLYISPLKALINDQTRRLSDIGNNIGIKITPWHGDESVAKKSSSFKDPSGILIITPESLESVLMHRKEGVNKAFANLHYIVIDEIHSFVGKERGKQVQSLISRIEHIVGRFIPRIGMSATLSDFEDIKLFIRPDRPSQCLIPKSGERSHELQVLIKEYISNGDNDYDNQILEDMFLRLRGTNNLVFTQSRYLAEDFTIRLSELSKREGVPNEFLVHHSSIDKDERHFVEHSLQEGLKPTTAICTSTLELGIDVGTVNSIAQIGPCPSVSSLRQRLGRSGRRDTPSKLRIYNIDKDDLNDPVICLSFSLIQSIAMVELIRENKFEPYNIGQYHFSTLIQQILSVLSQYGSFYPKEGWTLLCKKGAFTNVTPELFAYLLKALGKQRIIALTRNGQIVIGDIGEKVVKDVDFYAAFNASQDVDVIEKNNGLHIGTINQAPKEGTVFILSGRNWRVVKRDERGIRIFVEETNKQGNAHFSSTLIDVDRIIVAKMRTIYESKATFPYLDPKGMERLRLARETYKRIGLSISNRIALPTDKGGDFHKQQLVFFTWAGTKVNRTIRLAARLIGEELNPENAIYIPGLTEFILKRIKASGDIDPQDLAALVPRAQKEIEKYDSFLPDDLLNAEFAKKSLDIDGMKSFLETM